MSDLNLDSSYSSDELKTFEFPKVNAAKGDKEEAGDGQQEK